MSSLQPLNPPRAAKPAPKRQGIARRQADQEQLDFASLREQGIAAVQELAGKIWSDYNLHDPGVTILEQLCFGLTELVYQTRVPVADSLANERGLVDASDYFLYKPQEILPSRPVTSQDYAKLLLDQVPEIDAIALVPLAAAPGLVDIRLKLVEPLIGQPLGDQQKAAILEQVRRLYQAQRNLAEDLRSIQLEAGQACYLQGTIETTGKRPLVDIYADVFFRAARCLSSHVRIERYETLTAEQADLTQVFEGPLTQHGYIHSEGLEINASRRPLEELNALISRIDGVKKVYHLELVDNQGQTIAPGLGDTCYFLQFPQTLAQQQLLKIDFNPGRTTDPGGVVQSRSAQSEQLIVDTRRALQKLEFEYRAFRSNKANASNVYQAPRGQPRQTLDYYSIQHQFPHVYGINAAGVSPGASEERRQQAKQLKAYLYPMEQLMANLLEQIQQLQQLFHRSAGTDATYFCQWLDNLKVPHLEGVYRAKVNPSHIAQIRAQYDPALERRSRALDTLLALYGEEFSQEALLHFNYYHEQQPGYWVIANKLRFLEQLLNISANRGGGPDLNQEDCLGNQGGLHRRLSILLGIENLQPDAPLSECFQHKGIQLRTSQQLLDKGEFIALAQAESGAKNEADTGLIPVAHLNHHQQQRLDDWQPNFNNKLTLSLEMLREGTSLSAYRQREHQGQIEVYFCPPGQSRGLLLKRTPKPEEALSYVHRFKKIITRVNQLGEGFYLVEHLLLRPRSEPPASNANALAQQNNHQNSQQNTQHNTEQNKPPNAADSFYYNRLSLVFPRWSARFSNPAFRQFAEKTLANQCPAHLLPQIYWVDLNALREFEQAYHNWHSLLLAWNQRHTNAPAQATQLDQAAQALRVWLERQSPSAAMWI